MKKLILNIFSLVLMLTTIIGGGFLISDLEKNKNSDIGLDDSVAVASAPSIDVFFPVHNEIQGRVQPSGSGTENDPYIVSTPEELAYAIYGQEQNVFYEQVNDIDLSGIRIIGRDAVGVTYNGNGYSIYNFYSVRRGGLFDDIEDSTIKNVKVVSSYVSADGNYTGGIVGRATNSIIENCVFGGFVVGETNVGGIVGMARNTAIIGCSNRGNIYGIENVGGVAGGVAGNYESSSYLPISFVYSFNIGAVYGNNYVGGLIGTTSANSRIFNSYNIGSIQENGHTSASESFFGGLVGQMVGTSAVEYSYNYGAITISAGYAGGIVGIMEDDSAMNTCVSLMDASFAPYVNFGALAGTIMNNNDLSNSVWGGPYCDIRDYSGGNDGGVDFIDPISGTVDDVFSAINFLGDPWYQERAIQMNLPYLRYESEEGIINSAIIPVDDRSDWSDYASPRLEGSGTEDDPYLIQSAEDLAYLLGNANKEEYYLQTANIDLSKTWWPSIPDFNGHYDGNGFLISGMYSDRYGLFFRVDALTETFVAKNITVTDAIIHSRGETGGIVSDVRDRRIPHIITEIFNCKFQGNILSSGDNVGGIVGYTQDRNNTYIVACENYGNIYAMGSYIGGIIGNFDGTSRLDYYAKPTLQYCRNAGNIVGEAYVGGIAGGCVSVDVNSSFNSGNITALDRFVGGIAGVSDSTIIFTYNHGLISGLGSAGIVGDGTNANVYAAFNLGIITSSYGISGTQLNDIASCLVGGYFTDYIGESDPRQIYVTNLDTVDRLSDRAVEFRSTLINDAKSRSIWNSIELREIPMYGDLIGNAFLNKGMNDWIVDEDDESVDNDGFIQLPINMYIIQNDDRFVIQKVTYNTNLNDEANDYEVYEYYYLLRNPQLVADVQFERERFEFTGWNTLPDGTGITFNVASDVEPNLYLYAQWKQVEFMITLNHSGATGGLDAIYSRPNEGFFSNSSMVTSITEIEPPVREGFEFYGYYTAQNGGGEQFIDAQGQIVISDTAIGQDMTIYAYLVPNVGAYYDSDGGYWYIEYGKMPQTKVTDSGVINALNGDSTLTDSDGVTISPNVYYFAGIMLSAKVYNGNEYCNFQGDWYLVEPIKWRLDTDLASNSTEYVTTDTLAVMDTIVYVGAYSQTALEQNQGYVSANSDISSVQYFLNNFNITEKGYLVDFSANSQHFTTTGPNGNESSTSSIFLSSQEEISNICGNYVCEFSDLVTDYLSSPYGNGEYYFLRDLGNNLNNVVVSTESGGIIYQRPNYILGMRLTIKVTEFVCV